MNNWKDYSYFQIKTKIIDWVSATFLQHDSRWTVECGNIIIVFSWLVCFRVQNGRFYLLYVNKKRDSLGPSEKTWPSPRKTKKSINGRNSSSWNAFTFIFEQKPQFLQFFIKEPWSPSYSHLNSASNSFFVAPAPLFNRVTVGQRGYPN